MPKLSVIITYYKNTEMLKHQLEVVNSYSDIVKRDVEFIVVDDASPINTALEVISSTPTPGVKLKLYRITKDIQWGQEQARNLGAYASQSDFVFFLDIDHVIPPKAMDEIINLSLSPSRFYTFGRDMVRSLFPFVSVPRKASHCLFIINKNRFFEIGGYDESFSGHYGYSDAYFQHRARGKIKNVHLEDIRLQVFQYTVIPNAQGIDHSRDKKWNQLVYNAKMKGLVKFDDRLLQRPWERVI
jgi:glycosyltransferase involved in cell wall biosynthesis